MTVSVWFSKKWHTIIPFDRIIGCESHDSQLKVALEGDQTVMVDKEEIQDFKESYQTYVQISELVSLGVETEGMVEGPKKKGAKSE